jgi:hypothetical protein
MLTCDVQLEGAQFHGDVVFARFGEAALPSVTGRMADLLEEVADRVGIDVFGIGEHHRAEILDSVPAIML